MTASPDASFSSAPGGTGEIDTPTIHVALDVRLIHHSGIGSYLRGLLHGFGELLAPVEWTLIGPRFPIDAALNVRDWIEFDAPLYSWAEFRHYPAAPRADVFHYPHYNLPWVVAKRRLVTVYDLFHLLYGDVKQRTYQRLFLRRLAWCDAGITTISEKTRDDLRAHGVIAPARVHLIALGPGRPGPLVKPGRASPVRLSSGATLAPPWFLATGIDKPHKNMDFLIAAMALWYRRRPDAPPLVWTGVAEDRVEARVAAIPAHARKKIFIEPYREPEAIEELYGGAMALIFPSIDEGFGFPPLEAMARGVPAVCAQCRPMTDILGDAPLWFDPADSSTLWRALDRLIDEPGLREDAAERGRGQAAKYSWRETARQTYRLYCHLLESAG